MRKLAVALLAALALTTACGSDQDPAIEPPSTTSTSTSDDGAGGSGGPATTFAGGTTAVSVASSEGKAFLVDVRAARQDGFERVAFEFREGTPGYEVQYVDPPVREDGSGDEVEVAGGAVLVIRMTPAAGFDTEAGDGGEPTYNGPRRFTPATDVVREIVRTGDFEAYLTWAVGLDRRRAFRVEVSTSPKPVLFVDIATD